MRRPKTAKHIVVDSLCNPRGEFHGLKGGRHGAQFDLLSRHELIQIHLSRHSIMGFVEVFPAYDCCVFEGSCSVDARSKVFYCGDEVRLEEILNIHVVYDCFWSIITAGEEKCEHCVANKPVLHCQFQNL